MAARMELDGWARIAILCATLWLLGNLAAFFGDLKGLVMPRPVAPVYDTQELQLERKSLNASCKAEAQAKYDRLGTLLDIGKQPGDGLKTELASCDDRPFYVMNPQYDEEVRVWSNAHEEGILALWSFVKSGVIGAILILAAPYGIRQVSNWVHSGFSGSK